MKNIRDRFITDHLTSAESWLLLATLSTDVPVEERMDYIQRYDAALVRAFNA